MTLPIELVPNTRPQRFRWRQTVDTISGKRAVEYEGALPPSMEEAVVELVRLAGRQTADVVATEDVQRCRIEAERAKLREYKESVHALLDQYGVPTHPPETNGEDGCRVVDRLEWVVTELENTRRTMTDREARWEAAVGSSLGEAEGQAGSEPTSHGSPSRRDKRR